MSEPTFETLQDVCGGIAMTAFLFTVLVWLMVLA